MFAANKNSTARDARMPMIKRRAFYALVVAAYVAAALSVALTTRASAQAGKPADPTREQLEIQIEILKDRIKQFEDAIGRLEVRSDQGSIDPLLLKAYLEAQKQQYDVQNQMQRKQYEYFQAVLDWNIKAIEGQRFAYNIILFLVALVVVAGTAFSGFQLWNSSVTGVQATNDFEVSASKIRVTSSVVGLIVLIISLGFLYIYTREIYQVRVVDTGGAQSRLKQPE